MREIKFRAWHKPTQLMDDVVLIDFYNEKIGILYADPVMQCESIQKYNFNEVELMQYTGLKDKNGVEIYEGDIIGIDVYYVDDFGETYKERNYAEVFREQSGFWDCDFKDDSDGEFLIDYVAEEEGIDYPWNITVEGNIYENSEWRKHEHYRFSN